MTPYWLRDHPRLRYQRYLNLRDLPPRTPDHCRWCSGLITAKGRRTWCSTACRDEFLIRHGTFWVIKFVRQRDHDVCAHCHETVGYWEADHILPVCEGGGCCGLDNYRTLCRSCHNAETKRLRARLAKAKRRQLEIEIVQCEKVRESE